MTRGRRRPPRLRARTLPTGLLLLLGLAAAGCDPLAVEAPPPPVTVSATSPPSATPTVVEADGIFRYALRDPAAIVPPEVVDDAGEAVADALFDSLTVWDDRQRPAPSAAVSWTPSADARVWTFSLRADAVFHDGTPVTAADFAFAWDLAVAGAAGGPAGDLLRDVRGWEAVADGGAVHLAGVRALDDRTLEVSLDGPRADFPVVVGHPALGPVARERWREDPDAYRDAPVGNGPFEVTEARAPGQFIRTARAPQWSNGEPPRIGGVLFQIDDIDTAFLAFQQGRRDFTVLPPEAVQQASTEFPATSADGYRGPGVLLGDAPTLYFYAFNPAVAPYDDPAVRRAVSLTIDRQRIATESLDGNLSPATSVIPPALPGARRGTCLACTLNLVGANEVFTERGIDRLSLDFNAGGGHERVRDVLRAALARIDVTLISNRRRAAPAFPEYLARLEEGDAGMFRFGWTAAYPSLDDALYPLFHSSQVPENGGANYMRYANPEVDRLLDEARATLDQGARDVRYRQVERIVLNDDQIVAPVVTYHLAAVASERVRGLVYSPFGTVNLTQLRVVD